jgi:transcriptional regulator with GAF, ATPase, and Fis domain
MAVQKNTKAQSNYLEFFQFEKLISDLCSSFVDVDCSKVDDRIEGALKKIVKALDIERSTLGQYSEEKNEIVITHSWASEGVEKIPLFIITGELYPWATNKILNKEIVIIPKADDFPEEANIDKESFKNFGHKSGVAIPLSIAKLPLGLITFSTYTRERDWPEELIHGLKLIGEVFSNALHRKQTDEKLKNAFDEINILKEQLKEENHYLREEIKLDHNYADIIGNGAALKYALHRVEQVAPTDTTVLIEGETGTGKELIARAIHNKSKRKDRALIKVNCAAMPLNLIESELFGHDKGAFTGAVEKRIGRFELADKGTIFLDEIGELSLDIQVKLLRVMQESEFERLGSSKTINVDVRVITATNRILKEEVQDGKFREDLYYRLSVFTISVPSLNERREDIPLLAEFLVKKFNKKLGKKITKISKQTLNTLQKYSWPGNIRELENVIERAMVIADGSALVIKPSDFSITKTKAILLEDIEREHISKVLEIANWRVRGKDGAAEILGLKPTTLDSKIRKLNIDRSR